MADQTARMANQTMLRFGYPATRIAETERWSIQLRPEQPTLGSLVLVAKDEARAFSELSPEAFTELKTVTARIERMLARFVPHERLNYLMLMMVDRDVHFHVIPRYEGVRTHAGTDFPDRGWPGPPALKEAVTLDHAAADTIRETLGSFWDAAGR